MNEFIRCNLFSDKAFKVQDRFVVKQKELVLDRELTNGKSSFNKAIIDYKCQWLRQNDWQTRPTFIIPIRDSSELLQITIKNFQEHGIDKLFNIIVVDDRSIEDIKKITIMNNLSYLRIDNDKGFNFSMLNNIPCKICFELGVETVIFWNADLWHAKKAWFLELLERHYRDKSVVSGSKLLYPPASMSLCGEDDTANIKENFKTKLGDWRETVQFGGDGWIAIAERDSMLIYTPCHSLRFQKADNPRVNCDRGSLFVTGALHVWNLEAFIQLGGFNPTLSKNFQDSDICLRLYKGGICPMYYGKDIFFYHDESAVLSKYNKKDKQFRSDEIIFYKLWDKKLQEMIYGL